MITQMLEREYITLVDVGPIPRLGISPERRSGLVWIAQQTGWISTELRVNNCAPAFGRLAQV
jgi:hypothetical protein